MDTFKLPEHTPEQEARKHIAFELGKVVFPIRGDLARYDEIVRRHGLIWIHFTDWYNNFDLPLLEKEGLIERDVNFAYQPNDTWQDHFPPDAYRLTQKATYILEYTGRYVWEGETEPPRKEHP